MQFIPIFAVFLSVAITFIFKLNNHRMFDSFKLYVDLDLEKAKKDDSANESPYSNMVFSGVASDSSKDDEEEVLEPSGFIYDRFLKSGLFNLDHLPTRSPINKSRFWIGEPIEAYVRDNKFFVKGKLWEKSPEARAFWDKAIEMKESGSTRKPGMSVEGKALERDKRNPKRVTKALITNIALTMTPVNTKTYLDIEKSKGNRGNDLLEMQKSAILFEYCTENGIVQIDNNFKVNFQKSHSFDVCSFWEIYKSVQKGRLDRSVLDTLVERVRQ